MADRGIIPELEVFDLGMVNMIGVLRKGGLLPGPIVVNLFLGNIAGAQAVPLDLGVLLAALPNDAIWSGAGLGAFRSTAHALALAAGGGVRVGLEDGIHLDVGGDALARNADLVTRALEQGRLLGRSPMSPDALRVRLAQW